MTPTKSLVKAPVVASALDVEVKQLYRLVASGRVPAHRLGRSVRFDLEEVLSATKATSLVPAPAPRLREVPPAVPEATEPTKEAEKPAEKRKPRRQKQDVRKRLRALDPYADLRR